MLQLWISLKFTCLLTDSLDFDLDVEANVIMSVPLVPFEGPLFIDWISSDSVFGSSGGASELSGDIDRELIILK